MEWTCILVKPDGVARKLIGEIIQRFENKGLNLVGMKLAHPSRELIENQYCSDFLKDDECKDEVIDYLSSGPMVAMVWEGEMAIEAGRQIIGVENPLESAPGSIRGDYAIQWPYVTVHGSRGVKEAEFEIGLWFGGEGTFVWENLLPTEMFSEPTGDNHAVPEEGKI